MSTPDQINAPAPATEGQKAPPPIQEPDRQAQGQTEVPSSGTDHDKKPETADDKGAATPKTAKPS